MNEIMENTNKLRRDKAVKDLEKCDKELKNLKWWQFLKRKDLKLREQAIRECMYIWLGNN